MPQNETKIDTFDSLKVEKVELEAEKASLLAELTMKTEENEENSAIITEQARTILELQGQLESVTAERDKYKTAIQSDTGNQQLVLRKMEKVAERISAAEKDFEKGLEKLTTDEAAVLRVHRQDKINELRAEKDKLRSIITRKGSE